MPLKKFFHSSCICTDMRLREIFSQHRSAIWQVSQPHVMFRRPENAKVSRYSNSQISVRSSLKYLNLCLEGPGGTINRRYLGLELRFGTLRPGIINYFIGRHRFSGAKHLLKPARDFAINKGHYLSNFDFSTYGKSSLERLSVLNYGPSKALLNRRGKHRTPALLLELEF